MGAEPDLEIIRHSASHVMAEAVKDMFGTTGVKLAIGPAIEDGFYYDFDLPRPLTEDDLPALEARMAEIIKSNAPFEHFMLPRQEARERLEEAGEIYKVELLDGLEDAEVSFYRSHNFVDMCRGPHVENTGQIGAFKLLSVAGAYWRGDEKRPMLQRIYGTAFATAEELETYLHTLEEAKRRDHRKLGTELDLYSIHPDEAGAGLIFWHPKGALVRKIIEDFWRDEHYKHGYELLFTPHIARSDLWRISGHLGFYKDNMYSPMEIDEQEYLIKPMNCPFHILIYKSRTRSYRDLPIRWAELGTVYRYERAGVLHGLIRVRGFTQDDAHIFCRPDQLQDEIVRVIDFVLYILRTFGFTKFDVYLSTQPEKFVGEQENWDRATDALRNALEQVGLDYEIDPGEGVFYGPKIDIKIRDSLKRPHQCSTIQVDFNIPERFGVTYMGEDGREHQPIMIHRALMGSLERFFGVLIEHYAGAFPLWLAPVQARILPITRDQIEPAVELAKKLISAGIRAETDDRNEKLGAKIRQAQLDKIPYMLVMGKKEVESGAVAVRSRAGGDEGAVSVDEFIARAVEENKKRIGLCI